jgi:ribosomal protein L16 Arg81 hydroxylase
MTPQLLDLAGLLDPVGSEDFFSTYWERRYLLLPRNSAGYYRSLLTAADLENFISNSDLRHPAIRLAKGGNYYAAEAYTRNVKHGDESFVGVPDIRRINEEYAQGATIALPAMHRTWPALAGLCERLQARFDHPVHANVYVTPGNASGFTPHYDIHEVFVLQVAGRKRWSIYAPVVELPHRSQPFTPQAYAGQAPVAEVTLDDGDLLYLPRGFLHSTTTSDGFSAHVTIGISVYTWVDLLGEYLKTAIATPELRKALMPGFASRAEFKPALERELIGAWDRLREQADAGALIDSFAERVRATHVPRAAHFKTDVTVITLDSMLQSPARGSHRFVAEGDQTMLEFNGVRYQVTAPVAEAIRAMTAMTTFRARDLEDALTADGRLALVRHLASIGFLARLR